MSLLWNILKYPFSGWTDPADVKHSSGDRNTNESYSSSNSSSFSNPSSFSTTSSSSNTTSSYQEPNYAKHSSKSEFQNLTANVKRLRVSGSISVPPPKRVKTGEISSTSSRLASRLDPLEDSGRHGHHQVKRRKLEPTGWSKVNNGKENEQKQQQQPRYSFLSNGNPQQASKVRSSMTGDIVNQGDPKRRRMFSPNYRNQSRGSFGFASNKSSDLHKRSAAEQKRSQYAEHLRTSSSEMNAIHQAQAQAAQERERLRRHEEHRRQQAQQLQTEREQKEREYLEKQARQQREQERIERQERDRKQRLREQQRVREQEQERERARQREKQEQLQRDKEQQRARELRQRRAAEQEKQAKKKRELQERARAQAAAEKCAQERAAREKKQRENEAFAQPKARKVKAPVMSDSEDEMPRVRRSSRTPRQTPAASKLAKEQQERKAKKAAREKAQDKAAAARFEQRRSEMRKEDKAKQKEGDERQTLKSRLGPRIQRETRNMSALALCRRFYPKCRLPANPDKDSLRRSLRRAMAHYHPDRSRNLKTLAEKVEAEIVFGVLTARYEKF